MEVNPYVPRSSRAYAPIVGGFLYDMGHLGRWRPGMSRVQNFELPVLGIQTTGVIEEVVTSMPAFFQELERMVMTEIGIIGEEGGKPYDFQLAVEGLHAFAQDPGPFRVKLDMRKFIHANPEYTVNKISSPELSVEFSS